MPNDKFFGRKARLTIYSATTPLFDESYDTKTEGVGVVIENNRIEFSVEHNSSKHPNRCSLTVYNLSEETRSALKKSPLKVVFEAGYVDQMSVIFIGDITYVLSTHDGPNWKTEMEIGDGDRLLNFGRALKTYKPGTTRGEVLSDLLQNVGQHMPENLQHSEMTSDVLHGGLALNGYHQDVVNDLVKPFGYTYGVQDGQAVILREEDTTGQLLVLNEANGMIGSPEFGKPDKKTGAPPVTIRCLLYPGIRPGRMVQVESRDLKGSFKALKVKHKGDTHGDDWLTEVEVKATSQYNRSKGGWKGGNQVKR